jgi:hypothetical protein
MQITFAGQVIAQEPDQNGTDHVNGFLPDGDQDVQVAKFTRAVDAELFPRGNRVFTLTGTITPVPFASNGAAVLDMMTRFAGLPTAGPLEFLQDSQTVVYGWAALKKLRSVSRDGVSVTYELTFLAVRPVPVPAPFTSQSGSDFTTQGGTAFTPNP